MKYFIDFEATQYSNEIIAVGCIREDGKTFYSLIKPHKKLTPFIISLTGIKNEELEYAKSSDEVFSEFFDWMDQSSSAEFYCYGNCDITFIRKNLYCFTKSFKAQCALTIMATTLKDYSHSVKNYFRLKNCISLVKVISYFRGLETPVVQNHNALEDAIFLKEVYDNISKNLKPIQLEEIPFPGHETIGKVKIDEITKNSTINMNCIVYKKKKGEIINEYQSMAEAVEAALKMFDEDTRKIASLNKNRVAKKINRAFLKKEQYLNYRWEVIPKEG